MGKKPRNVTGKKLVAKTALKSKTPLKSSNVLRGRSIPKKQKKSPIVLLKKNADKYHSYYVRLRDTEYDPLGEPAGWYGKCITCNKYGLVAWIDETGKLRFTNPWSLGHYISRGNWSLRYEEENCNLQCKMHCNKLKSGNIERYKLELDLKYGVGTRAKLDKWAQDNKAYKISREELEQVIHDSKESIKFYRQEIA